MRHYSIKLSQSPNPIRCINFQKEGIRPLLSRPFHFTARWHCGSIIQSFICSVVTSVFLLCSSKNSFTTASGSSPSELLTATAGECLTFRLLLAVSGLTLRLLLAVSGFRCLADSGLGLLGFLGFGRLCMIEYGAFLSSSLPLEMSLKQAKL